RDVGFRDPVGLVAARAPLTRPRYQTSVAQRQFYEALVSRSAALPGVRHAGLIDEVPGGGSGFTTFEPIDRPIPRSAQPRAALRIVSASLARLLVRDGATVGRRLRLATTGQAEWQVVGVVGDVQVAALDADSPPVVYLSHLQMPENRMTLVLRTRIAVAAVASQLRA